MRIFISIPYLCQAQNINVVGRKRKKFPIHEKVEILDIGAEGKAIAKKDEMVIFVANAIPGDVVDLQITKKRKA